MEQSALLARLDRLESIDEIRQLAGKYSLSLDMRDLDAGTFERVHELVHDALGAGDHPRREHDDVTGFELEVG